METIITMQELQKMNQKLLRENEGLRDDLIAYSEIANRKDEYIISLEQEKINDLARIQALETELDQWKNLKVVKLRNLALRVLHRA